MSVQAIAWVLEHSQARLGARCVLIAIANHADEDGRGASIKISTIAKEARLSEREVRYAIGELKQMGELMVEYGAGPKGTTVYYLPRMGANFAPGGQTLPQGQTLPPTRGANFAPPCLQSAENKEFANSGGQNPAKNGGYIYIDLDLKKDLKKEIYIYPPEGANFAPLVGKIPQKVAHTEPPGWELFWAAYPKKLAKKEAFAAWVRTKGDKHVDEILRGLEDWKRTEQWQNMQFIPYPATFLNNERWKDAIPEEVRSGSRQASRADERRARAAEISKDIFGRSSGLVAALHADLPGRSDAGTRASLPRNATSDRAGNSAQSVSAGGKTLEVSPLAGGSARSGGD